MLSAFYLTVLLGLTASSTAKQGVSEKKVIAGKINLGWPNFFNPDKAILRKEDGSLKHKKATAGDKSSILGRDVEVSSKELLEANRLTNIIKDSDNSKHNVAVQNFAIKDKIRGALIFIGNESSYVETIMSTQEFNKIKNELKQTKDVYSTLSEVTDDGLRLSVPLFRKRSVSSLGKYGAEITYFYGEKKQFIYYGNWCGASGRIAPVDDVDECCLEHAKCYGRKVKTCPDIWQKPYSTMYAWTLLRDVPYCVQSEASCVNGVCGCDLEASRCMDAALQYRKLQQD